MEAGGRSCRYRELPVARVSFGWGIRSYMYLESVLRPDRFRLGLRWGAFARLWAVLDHDLDHDVGRCPQR